MKPDNTTPETALIPSGNRTSRTTTLTPFSASRKEQIIAFVLYLTAYAYTYVLFPDQPGRERIWLPIFTLAFVALAELLYWKTVRSRENWVWLGCVILMTAAIALNRCRVWEEDTLGFLHIYAVWWVLSRSGRLVENESGSLLPLDALNGFFLFPFKHFFLRLRTVWYTFTHLRRDEKKFSPETLWPIVLAGASGLVLFFTAASLLTQADDGFAALLDWANELFHFHLDEMFIFRLLISLPTGAYLFGLLVGCGRENPEKLQSLGRRCRESLEKLRRVPGQVWLALVGLFCLLYLLFFLVQARYLFGAFMHKLPEGFIVSEYARQGFFELCKVMGVNFLLLWLVNRTALNMNHSRKVLCLALLAESFLFAVVAFSKLMLYISNFGFTPRRLQSTWLVCVLACGCVCAAANLLSGKKTFRIWMMFGAVSMALLALY